MITVFDPARLGPPPPEGAVVSIGVFDGVHLGHQAILSRNVSRARELGAQPTVVTFRRHPKRVLLGNEPRTLTSLEYRLALFRRHGIARTLALTFDEELRALRAEDFVARILVEQLGARAFVLGFDSKFGKDRAGTPELLRQLGHDVVVVPKVEVGARAVSSTAIREAVELGDLEGAARMLGRPVGVLGTVVHGRHLGRELGYPTANLDLHHQLHPPVGVYACQARRVARDGTGSSDAVGEEPFHPAVTNIGHRPTISGAPGGRPADPSIEVHLLDFDEDLYAAHVEVLFFARLRAEKRFEDLAALRRQISADCDAARAVLASG